VKDELRALSPAAYTGLAAKLARSIVRDDLAAVARQRF
jgi:hypothetical protein